MAVPSRAMKRAVSARWSGRLNLSCRSGTLKGRFRHFEDVVCTKD